MKKKEWKGRGTGEWVVRLGRNKHKAREWQTHKAKGPRPRPRQMVHTYLHATTKHDITCLLGLARIHGSGSHSHHTILIVTTSFLIHWWDRAVHIEHIIINFNEMWHLIYIFLNIIFFISHDISLIFNIYIYIQFYI